MVADSYDLKTVIIHMVNKISRRNLFLERNGFVVAFKFINSTEYQVLNLLISYLHKTFLRSSTSLVTPDAHVVRSMSSFFSKPYFQTEKKKLIKSQNQFLWFLRPTGIISKGGLKHI